MREGAPQGAQTEGERRVRRSGESGEGAERGAGDRQEVPLGRKLTYFSWADLFAAKATVETARCSVRLAGSQAGCRPRSPPPSAQRAVSFIHSSFLGKAGIPSQS
ncbi:unnamed protein product [Rangifer tarandus platyrhynchus]|uniref:Uncharacterized protein n=2 Tax=Rangifer tarandus platyrhynchus TaxID=3082113 RepID=A0ABN8YL64_RANTA|nr:unnamed protein product [Rangifer tarandus platyrhynchus]CAI9696804.1 unnamed protein product [Rangifer tarandus platyrhynchus]